VCFAVLPHDAQEVGIAGAMRLVDFAFVAARDELLLRRRGRRARAGDQHRIWIAGHELQHLTGDGRIGAVVLLLGRDLDAGRLRRALHLVEPALAVGVVETDVAHRLHARRFHVIDDGVGHQAVGLRRLEDRTRRRICD